MVRLVFDLSTKDVGDLEIAARVASSFDDYDLLRQIDKNLKTLKSSTGLQQSAKLVKIPKIDDENQYYDVVFLPFSDVNDPTGSLRARLPNEMGLFVWNLGTVLNSPTDGKLSKMELSNLSDWIQLHNEYDDVIVQPADISIRDEMNVHRSATSQLLKKLQTVCWDVKPIGDRRRFLAFILPVDKGVVPSQAAYVRRCIPKLIDDVCKRSSSAEWVSLYVVLDVGQDLGLTRIEDIVDNMNCLEAAYTGVDAGSHPVSCTILYFKLSNKND